MSERLCNVAVAVPLRTTFTYKIPARLAADVQPGSRVLVPFRKRSTVGVVTEFVTAAPPGTRLREIQKALDLVPALTQKLLELGLWIANYYVAPIGEVYRAMLPPLTELRARQQVVITEAGRAAADAGGEQPHLAFLRTLGSLPGLPLHSAARAGIAMPELVKLQRRGLLEIRQEVAARKRRTQRVIAWKPDQPAGAELTEKEERLRTI